MADLDKELQALIDQDPDLKLQREIDALMKADTPPPVQQLTKPFMPPAPAAATPPAGAVVARPPAKPSKFLSPKEIEEKIKKQGNFWRDLGLNKLADTSDRMKVEAALLATGQDDPANAPSLFNIPGQVARGAKTALGVIDLDEFVRPGQQMTADDRLGQLATGGIAALEMAAPIGVGALLKAGGKKIAAGGIQQAMRGVGAATKSATNTAQAEGVRAAAREVANKIANNRAAQMTGALGATIAAGTGAQVATDLGGQALGLGEGTRKALGLLANIGTGGVVGHKLGSKIANAATSKPASGAAAPDAGPITDPARLLGPAYLEEPLAAPIPTKASQSPISITQEKTTKARILPKDDLPTKIDYIKEWLAERRPENIRAEDLIPRFSLRRNEARRVLQSLQEEGWVTPPTKRFESATITPQDEAFQLGPRVPGYQADKLGMARAEVDAELGPVGGAIVPERWYSPSQQGLRNTAEALGLPATESVAPLAGEKMVRPNRVETVTEYGPLEVKWDEPNQTAAVRSAPAPDRAFTLMRKLVRVNRQIQAIEAETDASGGTKNIVPPALLAYRDRLQSWVNQHKAIQANRKAGGAPGGGAPGAPPPGASLTAPPPDVRRFDIENRDAIPANSILEKGRRLVQTGINPLHSVDEKTRAAAQQGAPLSNLGTGEIAAVNDPALLKAQERRFAVQSQQQILDEGLHNDLIDLTGKVQNKLYREMGEIPWVQRLKDVAQGKPRVLNALNQYLHEMDQLERMQKDPTYVPAEFQVGETTKGRAAEFLLGKEGKGLNVMQGRTLDEQRQIAIERANRIKDKFGPILEPIAQRIYEFRNKTRQMMHDEGIHSDAQFNELMSYEKYAPAQRQADRDMLSSADPRTNRRMSGGGKQPTTGVDSRSGESSKPTDNQLEALIDQRFRANRNIANNRAVKAYADIVAAGQNPQARLRIDLTGKSREALPKAPDGKEFIRYFDQGVEKWIEMPKEDANALDGWKQWAKESGWTPSSGMLDAMQGALKSVWVGTNAAVQVGLLVPNLFTVLGTSRRPGSFLKNLPAAGGEWLLSRINPDMKPKVGGNWEKLAKWRVSPAGQKILGEPMPGRVVYDQAQVPKGLDLIGNIKEMRRQAAGGAQGEFHEGSPAAIVESIIYRGTDPVFLARRTVNPVRWGATVDSLIKRLSYSLAVDESFKLAAAKGTYRAARKAGDAPKKAMGEAVRDSIDANIDFTLGGPVTKSIQLLLAPFMNPTLQGARSLGKGLRGDRGTAGQLQALGMMTNAAVASMITTAWNLADPERRRLYQEMDDQTKSRGLFLLDEKVDAREKYGPNRAAGAGFKLESGPKIAADVARRMTEVWLGEQKDITKAATEFLLQVSNDVTGYEFGSLPYTAKSVVGLWTGQDPETGIRFDTPSRNAAANPAAKFLSDLSGKVSEVPTPAGLWQERLNNTPLLNLAFPPAKIGNPNRSYLPWENIPGQIDERLGSVPLLQRYREQRRREQLRRALGGQSASVEDGVVK